MTEAARNKAYLVLLCGALIAASSLGLRHSLGLFLKPIGTDLNVGREVFGLAAAIHNLVWGIAQPFAGMIADKWGSGRVVILGAILYGVGLWLTTKATGAGSLYMSLGVLVGLGLSGTTFAVILGAVGRAFPPEKRSAMLGLVSAGGSFGMFAVVPVGQAMLSSFGWIDSFLVFAAWAASLVLLAGGVGGAPPANIAGESQGQSMKAAIAEATAHRGYWLLVAGFFVCGFHVAFINTHLPAFLSDHKMDPKLGATALALIGLFNIIGSYVAGLLGGKHRKKYLLAWLYLLRGVAIVAFMIAPLSELSVLVFAGVMGLLWLSTVPLTTGLVGQIFGVRYLSTLFGIVFFSHQVGSFVGAWLGGRLFDATGSYELMWWMSLALALAAALVHWPIADSPVARLKPAASTS